MKIRSVIVPIKLYLQILFLLNSDFIVANLQLYSSKITTFFGKLRGYNIIIIITIITLFSR